MGKPLTEKMLSYCCSPKLRTKGMIFFSTPLYFCWVSAFRVWFGMKLIFFWPHSCWEVWNKTEVGIKKSPVTDLGEHFARVSIKASNYAQKWERSHPTRVEIKGKDFLGLWNGSVRPQAWQLKQILDRFCCRNHQRELLMHWQNHPTCVTKHQHKKP